MGKRAARWVQGIQEFYEGYKIGTRGIRNKYELGTKGMRQAQGV